MDTRQTDLLQLSDITTEGAADGRESTPLYWCKMEGQYMEPLIHSGAQMALKPLKGLSSCLLLGDVYTLLIMRNGKPIKITGHLTKADTEDKVRVYSDSYLEQHLGQKVYNDFKKEDVKYIFKVVFAGASL